MSEPPQMPPQRTSSSTEASPKRLCQNIVQYSQAGVFPINMPDLPLQSQLMMKEYEHTADLDVLLCDEPGSVCQQLVERLQAAEFGGRVLEAA